MNHNITNYDFKQQQQKYMYKDQDKDVRWTTIS